MRWQLTALKLKSKLLKLVWQCRVCMWHDWMMSAFERTWPSMQPSGLAAAAAQVFTGFVLLRVTVWANVKLMSAPQTQTCV